MRFTKSAVAAAADTDMDEKSIVVINSAALCLMTLWLPSGGNNEQREMVRLRNVNIRSTLQFPNKEELLRELVDVVRNRKVSLADAVGAVIFSLTKADSDGSNPSYDSGDPLTIAKTGATYHDETIVGNKPDDNLVGAIDYVQRLLDFICVDKPHVDRLNLNLDCISGDGANYVSKLNILAEYIMGAPPEKLVELIRMMHATELGDEATRTDDWTGDCGDMDGYLDKHKHNVISLRKYIFMNFARKTNVALSMWNGLHRAYLCHLMHHDLVEDGALPDGDLKKLQQFATDGEVFTFTVELDRPHRFNSETLVTKYKLNKSLGSCATKDKPPQFKDMVHTLAFFLRQEGLPNKRVWFKRYLDLISSDPDPDNEYSSDPYYEWFAETLELAGDRKDELRGKMNTTENKLATTKEFQSAEEFLRVFFFPLLEKAGIVVKEIYLEAFRSFCTGQTSWTYDTSGACVLKMLSQLWMLLATTMLKKVLRMICEDPELSHVIQWFIRHQGNGGGGEVSSDDLDAIVDYVFMVDVDTSKTEGGSDVGHREFSFLCWVKRKLCTETLFMHIIKTSFGEDEAITQEGKKISCPSYFVMVLFVTLWAFVDDNSKQCVDTMLNNNSMIESANGKKMMPQKTQEGIFAGKSVFDAQFKVLFALVTTLVMMTVRCISSGFSTVYRRKGTPTQEEGIQAEFPVSVVTTDPSVLVVFFLSEAFKLVDEELFRIGPDPVTTGGLESDMILAPYLENFKRSEHVAVSKEFVSSIKTIVNNVSGQTMLQKLGFFFVWRNFLCALDFKRVVNQSGKPTGTPEKNEHRALKEFLKGLISNIHDSRNKSLIPGVGEKPIQAELLLKPFQFPYVNGGGTVVWTSPIDLSSIVNLFNDLRGGNVDEEAFNIIANSLEISDVSGGGSLLFGSMEGGSGGNSIQGEDVMMSGSNGGDGVGGAHEGDQDNANAAASLLVNLARAPGEGVGSDVESQSQTARSDTQKKRKNGTNQGSPKPRKSPRRPKPNIYMLVALERLKRHVVNWEVIYPDLSGEQLQKKIDSNRQKFDRLLIAYLEGNIIGERRRLHGDGDFPWGYNSGEDDSDDENSENDNSDGDDSDGQGNHRQVVAQAAPGGKVLNREMDGFNHDDTSFEIDEMSCPEIDDDSAQAFGESMSHLEDSSLAGTYNSASVNLHSDESLGAAVGGEGDEAMANPFAEEAMQHLVDASNEAFGSVGAAVGEEEDEAMANAMANRFAEEAVQVLDDARNDAFGSGSDSSSLSDHHARSLANALDNDDTNNHDTDNHDSYLNGVQHQHGGKIDSVQQFLFDDEYVGEGGTGGSNVCTFEFEVDDDMRG